jgi:ubiquinone/menaquinone biosynthesis C-methylase UbiE
MELRSNTIDNGQLAERTQKSQAYFNPVSLFFYDLMVYSLISRYFWGCKTSSLIERYQKFVGLRHLEVGVGTGYLLDHFDPVSIDLTLMDLSESCLNKSAKRLARYSPSTIKNNILERYSDPVQAFDSIGINYVMHCIPGGFSSKHLAFKNLKLLLASEGVLFGVTVFKTPNSNIFARGLMYTLNKLGVFNNTVDSGLSLREALEQHFTYVDINTHASAASFYATDNEKAFLAHQADQ